MSIFGFFGFALMVGITITFFKNLPWAIRELIRRRRARRYVRRFVASSTPEEIYPIVGYDGNARRISREIDVDEEYVTSFLLREVHIRGKSIYGNKSKDPEINT